MPRSRHALARAAADLTHVGQGNDGKADGDEHRSFVVADVPDPASAIAADTGLRIGFSGDLGER